MNNNIDKIDFVLKKIAESENYQEKSGDVITFVNPISFCSLVKQEAIILEKLDAIFVDGFYAALVISFFVRRKIKRRSLDMTSLGREILNRGVSIGLIGGSHEELRSATETLEKVSKSRVYSLSDGYFDYNDQCKLAKIAEKIKQYSLDYVFVGLGVGLQENISTKLAVLYPRVVFYTCGGFITQTAKAGKVDFYPKYIDKFNLRWCYRLYKEPHTRKRVLKVFQFIYILIVWRMSSKIG